MQSKYKPVERACLYCGRIFLARTFPSCAGRGKYCSHACNGRGRYGALAERFWRKVDKSGECWLWTGGKDSWGYGAIKFEGKQCSAHHVAWELANGRPVPDGLFILHKCPGGGTPACVRPDHLKPGDHAENMRDRESHRQARRSKRHLAATIIDLAASRTADAT